MAFAQISVPTAHQITALYLRISDADDELGVARQRKDMAGRAEQFGLPVLEFCDNNFSASRYARRKRPKFTELLHLIEAGRVAHVVFWDLSRLVRQPKELEQLIDLADAGTVEVHTMTGRIDLRDPDGRAMARVVTVMNAKASDDTSKRIKRQQAQAREEGRYHGGGRPFGFEASGAVVREDEAELIREAADRVLRGEGLLTIAKDWNARGLTAPLGGPFRPKTIRDALLRPLTVQAGILPTDRQIELQAVLDDPTRRRQWSTARTHLLSGMMTCGRCGGRMRSKPRNDGKATYACDACHLSRLAAPLDDYVTEAVLNALDGPGLAEAVHEQAEGDEEAAGLVAALEGYGGRLRALEVEFEEGEIDMATFKRMRASLEAKAADVRRSLAQRSRRRVAVDLPAGETVRDWWAKANLDQRRAVIDLAIESIVVRPADRGRRAFDPGKIGVAWRF